MKNNILKQYINRINCIFISLYLLIIFMISYEEKIIYFSKLLNVIILLILLLSLTISIIMYSKFKKENAQIYQIDSYYYDFFIKYYLKNNKTHIYYALLIIFFSVLSVILKSSGIFFLSEFVISAVVILIIRKRVLIKDISSIKLNIIKKELPKDVAKKAAIKHILIHIIITVIITLAFCKFTNAWYAWFIIVILSLIILLFKFIINNPFNKYYTLKNKMFSIKIYNFLVLLIIIAGSYVSMIIGVYFLRGYIYGTEKVATTNHKIVFEDNMYKIYKNKEDFKILQLSDIHIGGSFITYHKDLKALEAIDTLVTNTKPDLIIITGDLVYPTPIQSFYLNNQTALFQLTIFMNYLAVPWTFVYGNHETEDYAFRNYKDLYNMVLYSNSKMAFESNSLLFYNYDDTITGRSNMILEIINPNQTINQILYLMDSNDYYTKKLNDYDYIHDDQVNWYKTTLEKIGVKNSSMIFFHIPLIETKEAIDLYLKGDKSVKYFFGEFNEEVACSKYKSKLFDEAVKLKSTKAMFYGHDHTNNISLEYQGIRLTYGLSIDYLATLGIENKTSQRGATLITLKDDSKFDIKQIKLKDIQNQQK